MQSGQSVYIHNGCAEPPELVEALTRRGPELRDVRIVHGKGTGALRRSVEALLARHPLVVEVRPAQEDAGGWGATLVRLR